MTPQIFPGLKQPTSSLFFALQAFIAENGGRLRLAHELEIEQNKVTYPNRPKFYTHRSNGYSKNEVEFIKENYLKMSTENLALLMGRPIFGLQNKIWNLQLAGILKFKTNRK